MQPDEVDRMLRQVRDKRITEEPEKYRKILGGIHKHTMKIEILKKIFAQVDSESVFLSMASVYFATMETEGKESCGTSTLAYLRFVRSLCKETEDGYEQGCKVVFAYLEKSRYRYLEVKNEAYEMVEEARRKGVQIHGYALDLVQTEQPVSILSELLVFLGTEAVTEVAKYVLSEGEKTKSAQLQKNTGMLLVCIAEMIQRESAAEVAELYVQGMESEVQMIRNQAIEGAEHIAEKMKEEIEYRTGAHTEVAGRMIQELTALTESVCRRTRDVSPFCRARAVQTLSEMLSSNSVLRVQKQRVLEDVVERLQDKTHIVRKKAVQCMKRAVETHPFSIDGGVLSAAVIAKCKKIDDEYHRDCVAFHDTVQSSIESVKEILDTGAKGEITEIVQYVSVCVSYGVEGAMDVFPRIFALSWSRVSADGKNTADTLVEEVKRMTEGDARKLIAFVLHFDTPALSYDGFVRDLTLRGILSIRAVNEITAKIDAEWMCIKSSKEEEGRNNTADRARRMSIHAQANEKHVIQKSSTERHSTHIHADTTESSIKEKSTAKLVQYMRLLRRISATDRSVVENNLDRVLEIQRSTECSEVVTEIVMLLGNLDYRVANTSHIISAITKTLKGADSMALVQSVIDTGYLISTDPDALAVEMLETLCTEKRLLPLLFAVGHIAIKHAVHLERLEAAWNTRGRHTKQEEQNKNSTVKKTKRESVVPSEIRERRLSVGTRRNTVGATTEEQEELADKVFFAKEHEIVYGEDAALQPFVRYVEQHMYSADTEVQKIALVSVGKIMAISSEYNAKHMPYIVEMLKRGCDEMKIVCLMVICDSVMAFSSLVGSIAHMLFVPLSESAGTEVKITAVAMIRHLLKRGMIKIKEKYWVLAQLLGQETEEKVRTAAQRLFEEAMEREAPLKILCEVIKTYAKESSKEEENRDKDRRESKQRRQDAEFVDILQSLCAISGSTDISKKVQEWAHAKNEVALTRVCALAVPEIAKGCIRDA